MILINLETISVTGSAPVTLEKEKNDEYTSVLFQYLASNHFTLTNSLDGNFLIALNHNQNAYRTYINNGGSVDRAVLIRLEPPSVFPGQYKNAVTRKYSQAITPGLAENRERCKFFVGWPYKYHLNPGIPSSQDPALAEILLKRAGTARVDINEWLSRPNKVVMVAANKVSPLGNSNYNLRRHMAHEIPNHVLQVYGAMWQGEVYSQIRHRAGVISFSLRNRIIPSPKGVYGGLFSKYSTSKGTIDNKHEVLKTAKFSLVIENSDTIMSEKLFDAILNGTVPIYIGPSLRKLKLPGDLAITSIRSPEQLMSYMENFDLRNIKTILQAGKDFLNSSSFTVNWCEEGVYRQIGTHVSANFRRCLP